MKNQLNRNLLLLIVFKFTVTILFFSNGALATNFTTELAAVPSYSFPGSFPSFGCSTIECSIRKSCINYIETHPNDVTGYELWLTNKSTGPYNYVWICRNITYDSVGGTA